MKPQEYREMSEAELKKKIKELDFNIARSYGQIEKTKIRPQHRKNFRREKALILTILREKEAQKDDKHS